MISLTEQLFCKKYFLAKVRITKYAITKCKTIYKLSTIYKQSYLTVKKVT